MGVKNLFLYGQVGNALDGYRDSEIAQQSAHSLLNFYISEMGTLKVAKSYDKIAISEEPIQRFLDTKYNYYLLFTTTKIISINKSNNQKISELAHGMDINYNSNINIFNDFIAMVDNSGLVKVFAINSSGSVGTTNFLDTIELPFSDKYDVKIDFYKVFEATIGDKKELRPELIRTYSEELELEVKNGKVYMKNTGEEIKRIYSTYKAALTKDNIGNMTKGDTYLIFHNYKKPENGLEYYFGNTKIQFTGSTQDTTYGGSYFTGATPDGATGKIRYGKIENFKNEIVDFLEHQSRLIIATKEKMYFSKVLDYNNFVPGTSNDDAFFLKLSPIDGNQPMILKMSGGNGIYVTLEKGIMVVGYDSFLTPSNSLGNILIAGNSEPTKVSAMIEGDFYYIDKKGLLRCIILTASGGRLIFSNEIAEKYNYNRGEIKWITRGSVDENNVCVCTHKNKSNLLIYSKIQNNLFRNFALEFSNDAPVFGFNENFISDKYLYKLTNNNYPKAVVKNNLPYVKDTNKGLFLLDTQIDYSRFVINTTATKGSITGIAIANKPIQNMQFSDIGNYNIFDYNGSINILDCTIEINTSQSEDIIEIRGFNFALRGGSM